MSVTITLAEPLAEVLKQRANELDLSVDELAAQLLGDLLLGELDQTLPDQAESSFDCELSSLEETVARIRALPPEPAQIKRGAKVGDKAYIAELLANPPQGSMTFAEWQEFWPKFEAELKALDLAAMPT
jgi:phosphoglycolate phosphatase-like HAD superfamily hydrolase